MPKTKKKLCKKRARTVPVLFDVYVGRKLIGWVDLHTYVRKPHGEWTAADSIDGRGRCHTAKQGAAILRAKFREKQHDSESP